MTSLGSLRVERPAVRAKGTVRPSERPIVASAMVRGCTRRLGEYMLGLEEDFSHGALVDAVVELCDRPVSESWCGLWDGSAV